MTTILIVEGPDGGGKSTLVNMLTETLDIPVSPRVVSQDTQAMTNLQDWVDNNLEEGFQRMIFDRYRLISETIYGPILRSKAEAGFDRMHWLAPRMKRFYELEPVIIYCLPPLDVVKKNLANDPDNKVVLPKIDAIYSSYVARAALDHTFSPGIVKVWDYTTSLQIHKMPAWLYSIKEHMEGKSVA